MEKMNLQLFAETVKGSKIIYLYRLHSEAGTEAGASLAFTTENSLSIEVGADATITKSGTIRTPGEPEITISATTMFKKGDENIDKYKNAMLEGELFDIWRANIEAPVTSQTGKYKGTYYQGYMTSFEEASNAEDFVEYTLEFGINGKGADGNVTVSDEDIEIANYVFEDSVVSA